MFMRFAGFAAALLAATAGAAIAGPAPRPIADFAALPNFDRPRLSPDGKHIAGKLAINGKQYFAIASVAADGSKPALVSGDLDLNWWRWVNDEWLVLGVGNKLATDYGSMYVRRAIGVNTAGKIVPLIYHDSAQNADDLVWVAHDGSPHVLLAAQKSAFSSDTDFWPVVYDVDVSTGKTRPVAGPREGVLEWVADGSGTVRMGIGHSIDGRTKRVLYRSAGGSAFKEIVSDAKVDDKLDIPSLFLADPNKAIEVADNDKGESAVFEYDLARLKRGRQLYASPGFDVDGIVTTADDAGLAGIRYDENGSRVEWLDPELNKIESEVASRVENASAHVSSYSRDYQRAIIFIGSPRSPGSYYLYDRASGALTPLSLVNPAIGMATLHPVRTIRYKARDGLEIAAVLTLPSSTGRNLPLIVLPHGGPFARDDESWDWWAQFLADRGYAVVQPNYRGSSGYGTHFAEKGEGQWGLAMQDDLNDAVAYLAKEGIADPKRVCMAGASYGGYTALRAAQRDGALYRCAISYAGVSDLGAMKRYDSQFLMAEARGDWLKKQAPVFKDVSPLAHAADFSIPVLILHGKADDVVPVDQSRDMARRLKAAGKPVTYIEQPLGDHHFTRSEDRAGFLTAMEAFLKQYNPADPAPAS